MKDHRAHPKWIPQNLAAPGCIAFLALLGSPCFADLLNYDITYDPKSGVTTLTNLIGSGTADLQFETLVGTLAGAELFVPAGDTVTIDGEGNVTGSYVTDPPVKCTNKTYHGGTFTVTKGFVGTITVAPGSTGYEIYTFDGSGNIQETSGYPPRTATTTFPPTNMYTIKAGSKQNVYLKTADRTANLVNASTDAQLFPITSDVQFIMQGPDWPGVPGEANIELQSGGLESFDDSNNFTSIFTPNVMTGCVPEPSSLLLIVAGLLAGVGLRVSRHRSTQSA